MDNEIKVGQRWLLSINGSYRLHEHAVTAIEPEAIKLDDGWMLRQAVKFVKLLADAPAEPYHEVFKPERYPFDLEAALAGAKLVTRDGREVTGFCKRAYAPDGVNFPYFSFVEGYGKASYTLDGWWSACPGHELDLFLTEPWSRPEAKPEPKLGDGWPWEPHVGEPYWMVNATGQVSQVPHASEVTAHARRFALFNVYRTEAEAAARAELDKRLAIHAALQQLGGGEDGAWAVRNQRETEKWEAVASLWQAPGEARFLTKEAAQAALDVLLDRGILKHGVAL